jgi:mono/diheme cytochrome c family protein
VDFARDIQPIFAASCYVCHGPGDQRGGLRLDAKKDALKGGTSGPVIIAGKSASSRLVHLIAGVDPNDVMPKKGERLTADQVGLLRAWIDQGADWPDTAHWSLAAPKRPSIPRIRNTPYATP